jgi:DNA integrity scanning protein DisA with diadenylate cyclase activity
MEILKLWLSDRGEERIVKLFQASENEKAGFLKLKLYSLLKALQKRRRSEFGMLAVFGWRKDWFVDYASFPDATQNLFSVKPVSLAELSFDRALDLFIQLSYFDGAILVDKNGRILASGVYLENMRPKTVAEKLCKKKTSDLSEAFGFVQKVHTRHLSGIACSYKLKGTAVFVISEESNALRVFEKGKITASPFKKEIADEN